MVVQVSRLFSSTAFTKTWAILTKCACKGLRTWCLTGPRGRHIRCGLALRLRRRLRTPEDFSFLCGRWYLPPCHQVMGNKNTASKPSTKNWLYYMFTLFCERNSIIYWIYYNDIQFCLDSLQLKFITFVVSLFIFNVLKHKINLVTFQPKLKNCLLFI